MDILSFNSILLALIDLLKYKNVYNVINFHCFNTKEAFSVQKLFISHTIPVASINMYKPLSEISYSHRRFGFILNTTCENWTSVIDNIDVINKFKDPFHWFVVTEDLNATEQALSRYPFEIDSRLVVTEICGEKYHRIYEMYNSGFYRYGSFITTQIGYWNISLQVKYMKRTNLTGVVLRSVVVVRKPVKNETYLEYIERSRPTKYDMAHMLKYYTLLKYLRDMYNHSYQLIRSRTWGYVHKDGSYDGMIGSLVQNTSDIGGCTVYFRNERLKLIDPTIEIWKFYPITVFRNPKYTGGFLSIFTRPLSLMVWMCILAVIGIASAILGLILRIRFLRAPRDSGDESFSLAILTIWSSICQQGSDILHSSTPGKLVCFVMCAFAATTYQYYNALIVSTLLQDPPKNIHNAKDLLASNIILGVHDSLYNRDFFRNTKDPVIRQLYNEKVKTATSDGFYDLEEGMAKVKKGGFAFLVDNGLAYAVMKQTFPEEALCDAGYVLLYEPQKMVGVIQKGSPYVNSVRVGMRLMYETGLMQRIESIWDEPRPACIRTPDSSLISVSLTDFATPLVGLAVGAILATLILLAEIIAHRLSGTKDHDKIVI